MGHIRGGCRARKHANGGDPKEFKKRGINNLEEGETGEDLGGLDICMLEKDENPFTNQKRSPNMPNPFLRDAIPNSAADDLPLFHHQCAQEHAVPNELKYIKNVQRECSVKVLGNICTEAVKKLREGVKSSMDPIVR